MMWLTRHVFLLLWMSVAAWAQEDPTCDAEGGATCRPPSRCGIPQDLCTPSGTTKASLYRHGGSAQAYTPNTPVKSVVCLEEGRKHKVATWAYYRSKRRASAPKLRVRAQLWSCTGDKECCCEAYSGNSTKVEVWQARPDGTYSSLGSANGDCRATLFPSETGSVEFSSVAPGSSGGLGGLGPYGWDLAPYGPPLLHMLVTDHKHEPLLIHIPVVPRRKTLEQQSFWGSDLRGQAGTRTANVPSFNITSWVANVDDGVVDVEVDVFLTRDSANYDVMSELCPSFLYGMPSSFFVEPIAVCAPSILDFFPL